jgi:TolA-binding protein
MEKASKAKAGQKVLAEELVALNAKHESRTRELEQQLQACQLELTDLRRQKAQSHDRLKSASALAEERIKHAEEKATLLEHELAASRYISTHL